MITLTFPEIFYLFSAFHGALLAILLLVHRRSIRINLALTVLLVLFSFYLLENVIYSSGYLVEVPHLLFATLPLIFLLGPLFYIYVRSNVYPGMKLSLADAILLIPFLVEVAILWPLYSLGADVKIKIYEGSLHSQQAGRLDTLHFFGLVVYTLSACWCFLKAFGLLSRVSTSDDPDGKRKRTWLKRSSAVFFSYMAISMILAIVATLDPVARPYTFHLNLVLQTLLIHGIGYVAFIHPDIFRHADLPAKKYQTSSLDLQTMSELRSRLLLLIEDGKPYLDSEISPDYFRDKLGISKHHFSQLLTEGMKTTFYDLINFHRVEAAKKLLRDGSYANAKILHIAYDSGFSNKSSFLRNFRKLAGTTPTEYREQQENQVPRN